jgi:hypothetical protein
MTDRTLTRADLERMAAANVSAFPMPEAERRAYAPATWALMAALAEDRLATVEELAAAAGRATDEVAALLRAIPDVEWDADGRVTGAGMTLNPTPHRVETGGHQLYAWCAPDALGMLPAIGRTVRISSPCPAISQTISVTAGRRPRRRYRRSSPETAIITGDPDDIRGSECDLGTSSPPGRRRPAGRPATPAGRCSPSPTPSTTPGPSCNSPTDPSSRRQPPARSGQMPHRQKRGTP